MGAEVWTRHTRAILPGTAGLRDAQGEEAGTDSGKAAVWMLPAALSCRGQPGARRRWGMALLGPRAPQGLSPSSCSPGACTGIPCAQHDLSSGSRGGDTSVGPCWSHAAGESPCLLLTGSSRPCSPANTAEPCLALDPAVDPPGHPCTQSGSQAQLVRQGSPWWMAPLAPALPSPPTGSGAGGAAAGSARGWGPGRAVLL